MPRRTVAFIERSLEEWVVLADGEGNEKHVLHISGWEELEKVAHILRGMREDRAGLDSKRWSDPFDVQEATA